MPFTGKSFARLVLVLFTGSGLLGGPKAMAQTISPDSVVVVANRLVEGSVEVASVYIKERGIPEANLIVVETAQDLRINRQRYLETLHNPILETLMARSLIIGLEGEVDALGRKSVTLIDNPIRYMVLCYGVPAIIPNSTVTEEMDRPLRERHFRGARLALVEQFVEGPLSKTEASVDGELALLLQRDVPLKGFFPNPYFRNRTPQSVRDIIKVTRLDGPSPEAVLTLLENTFLGEKNGLKGRAYVDEDGRGGSYQLGNDWMARTAEAFASWGFDLQHDTTRPTFAPTARFDAPVLYAGWYAQSVVGPFGLPGFRFPPGAIAAHLHSGSARMLRSPDQGWVGPLVELGVSATFGNVAEPYLRFTHHFDLFFQALGEGWNLADAAYYALPVLSWQAVTIGDPLYQPFKVGLEEQLSRAEWGSGDPLDAYVFLRQARLLDLDEKGKESRAVLERGMELTESPALALTFSDLLSRRAQRRFARDKLARYSKADLTVPTTWGLFAAIADRLRELGRPKEAVEIFQGLEQQEIPEKVLLAFLRRGIQAAEDAGKSELAASWRIRVDPPPPPPETTETDPETGLPEVAGDPSEEENAP